MAKEKRTVEVMIKMYCSARHSPKAGLCRKCAKLLDYAAARLDKCPFGPGKQPCARCAVHCYSPSMRDEIIGVMRYAGPRMIAKHPILALSHALSRR